MSYLTKLKSVLSDDPSIRRYQTFADSTEFIILSQGLKKWLFTRSESYAKLSVEEKVLHAVTDSTLTEEDRRLYALWAPQSAFRFLSSKQRMLDVSAFEQLIKTEKTTSVTDLKKLGLATQEAEEVFLNHLRISIAEETGISLQDIRDTSDGCKDLLDRLCEELYPYQGRGVPFIEVGWPRPFCFYGPMIWSWKNFFQKAPFPLENTTTRLYLVEIDLPSLGFMLPKQWKVGITQKGSILGKNSNSRFSGKSKESITPIREVLFSDGRDAYFLEQKIIHLSKLDRAAMVRSEREKSRGMPRHTSSELDAKQKHELEESWKTRVYADIKSCGLGRSEWIWKERDRAYVANAFDRIVAFSPYFGRVVDDYSQGSLDLFA